MTKLHDREAVSVEQDQTGHYIQADHAQHPFQNKSIAANYRIKVILSQHNPINPLPDNKILRLVHIETNCRLHFKEHSK